MYQPSRLTHLTALISSLTGRGFVHPAQIINGLSKLPAADRNRVMNAYGVGNPGNLQGMGFTVDLYEQISARAFDVKYPDLLWRDFIPAGSIESVNPGAKIVSARQKDWRGRGAFRAAVGKDIPTVGVSVGKISVPVEAGGVSAHVDIEEIRQVAFGFEGMSLLTDLGAAMRRAYELHREVVTFYGFSPLGFEGYINGASVPTTTAGTKAAGGTTWAVATPAEIVKDITTGVTTPRLNSKGIWKVNRIAVPTAQFIQLSMLNAAGTAGTLVNETLLTYLLRTLPAQAGGPVEIVELRYLEGAGAGATNRAVFEVVQNDTFWMPDAVPFNMLPPQDNTYQTSLFADYKFGGLLRPYPTSSLYMDGI